MSWKKVDQDIENIERIVREMEGDDQDPGGQDVVMTTTVEFREIVEVKYSNFILYK